MQCPQATTPIKQSIHMQIVTLIKIAVLVVMLTCGLIGTFAMQYKAKSGVDYHVFLYKKVVFGKTTWYAEHHPDCGEVWRIGAAAFAFGVVGCGVTFFATILSVVGLVTASAVPSLPGAMDIVRLVLIALGFVSFLITFALSTNNLKGEHCGTKLSASLEFAYGYALGVCAWIIGIAAVVLELVPTIQLLAAAPKKVEP